MDGTAEQDGRRRKRLALRRLVPAGILLALALPYYVCDREHRDFSGLDRAAVGQAAELSDGVTWYELGGPESGIPVVLVHGLTTPSFIWDGPFETLARSGFRVLRYDLFGRGYSDRPALDYDPALYDRQLLELLAVAFADNPEQPVHLVGLSMGGAVVTRFAVDHPPRVRSVSLISPAGVPVELPFRARIARAPLIGDYMMRALGDRLLASGLDRNVATDRGREILQRRFFEQTEYYGYKRAILSSLRSMPLESMQDVFERLGASSTPCLLLWGTADLVIPFELHRHVLAAMPEARFHALAGVGHVAPLDAPELTAELLLQFLRQPGRAR